MRISLFFSLRRDSTKYKERKSLAIFHAMFSTTDTRFRSKSQAETPTEAEGTKMGRFIMRFWESSPESEGKCENFARKARIPVIFHHCSVKSRWFSSVSRGLKNASESMPMPCSVVLPEKESRSEKEDGKWPLLVSFLSKTRRLVV